MNAEQVDIRALASLARLDISGEESASLEKDMRAILGFVREVQEVGGEGEERPALQNVMREDANPHESGLYTESLLAAAPAVKDGRVVVKQVVSRT
jgi:aspartyl/glutamyl-tRNA(Asn/Gln) amidotransferase C subunit